MDTAMNCVMPVMDSALAGMGLSAEEVRTSPSPCSSSPPHSCHAASVPLSSPSPSSLPEIVNSPGGYGPLRGGGNFSHPHHLISVISCLPRCPRFLCRSACPALSLSLTGGHGPLRGGGNLSHPHHLITLISCLPRCPRFLCRSACPALSLSLAEAVAEKVQVTLLAALSSSAQES
jgi:hypothetical protein